MKRTLFILVLFSSILNCADKESFSTEEKISIIRYYVYRQLGQNKIVGEFYYAKAAAAVNDLLNDNAKRKIFSYKAFGSGNDYVRALYQEVKKDLQEEFTAASADPNNKQSLDWLLK